MSVSLNKYHNSKLIINPSDQVINQYDFEHQYCTSSKFIHVYGKDNIPPNMPAPCGLYFMVTVRVDAEHTGETGKQLSRTGFIIYINSTSVYCMSKERTSCESFSFFSEFVATKKL